MMDGFLSTTEAKVVRSSKRQPLPVGALGEVPL